MTSYKWTEVYKAALLETDGTRMQQCRKAAETALQGRKQEFALNGGGSADENQAIDDALPLIDDPAQRSRELALTKDRDAVS